MADSAVIAVEDSAFAESLATRANGANGPSYFPADDNFIAGVAGMLYDDVRFQWTFQTMAD